ncbi:class I SAM-dependent methyltransferase [Anaeromyxobacter sp. Fw109-5]|uniref:class I SAM-dependent methyltransferase n=1 Tax=Anaeromyxobacter sp. (strain Fw109-5) TaxID=404589 RepID=UPI00190F9252|nr:class I SAM-dependent methyltransferase [Anaeromyxobacter sp. Fw109-5]
MNRYAATSPVGRLFLIPYRAYYATSYFLPQLSRIPRWLLTSRETGNFQYDVTEDNKQYAAHIVALVSGVGWDSANAFGREFEEEALVRLREHVARLGPSSPNRASTDSSVKPGRRLLYYTLVRALAPRLVVEAGTASGLGTCILASALDRNRGDGHPGSLVSIDLDPSSGWLLRDRYAAAARMRVGNVLDVLSELEPSSVDLYVHDTSADPALEAAEFGLLREKLAPGAVVLSVWHTHALMQLAQETGRRYVMFWSEPLRHWYPGSKLGIAFSAPAPAEGRR